MSDGLKTPFVVRIRYCYLCNWMLRSAWMAQEILNTFTPDVTEVRLIPVTGGEFDIHVNDILIWERKRDGGFPDVKALKQRVRDIVAPERDLGHVETKKEDDAK